MQTIEIQSVYKKDGKPINLPPRMATFTTDTANAILSIKAEVEQLGGELILSDGFRSYDMQHQANLDYVTGKKKAYSPPAGGSLHEAGRSFDLDVAALKMSLSNFWILAAKFGVYPIIKSPDPTASECWHFDCRGSFSIIYNYYKQGKASNMKAYEAQASAAILALGIHVDRFGDKQKEAFIQGALIRLGYDIGNIDGVIGAKTTEALKREGIGGDVTKISDYFNEKLARLYPNEY